MGWLDLLTHHRNPDYYARRQVEEARRQARRSRNRLGARQKRVDEAQDSRIEVLEQELGEAEAVIANLLQLLVNKGVVEPAEIEAIARRSSGEEFDVLEPLD